MTAEEPYFQVMPPLDNREGSSVAKRLEGVLPVGPMNAAAVAIERVLGRPLFPLR